MKIRQAKSDYGLIQYWSSYLNMAQSEMSKSL